MTKTYDLPNGKMIMADVDEKHHMATVSVFALDNLVETVNETGQWIDVKDSVPEENGEYLITWTGVLGANSTKRSKPLIGIAEYEIYEPENYEDWITTDNEFRHYHDIKVLAWQELPEPYKGDKERE